MGACRWYVLIELRYELVQFAEGQEAPVEGPIWAACDGIALATTENDTISRVSVRPLGLAFLSVAYPGWIGPCPERSASALKTGLEIPSL